MVDALGRKPVGVAERIVEIALAYLDAHADDERVAAKIEA